MRKVFIILILLLCTSPAIADTHAAADCEYATVAAAVAAAAGGDTVTVPAGSCTWTDTLTVTVPIILQGTGTTSTIITSNITDSDALKIGLIHYVPASPSAASRFRITGFYFDLDNKSGGITITIASATGEYIRIDHNTLDDPGGESARRSINMVGTVYGVIDNNTFTIPDSGGETYDIAIRCGGTDNGAGNGKLQWDSFNATVSYGSVDNLYIEDNTFSESHGNTIMHSAGGRSVIRYNSFGAASENLNALIDVHGNQETNYATMMNEIYGNSVDFNTAYDGYFVDHRGGQALIFYNRGTSCHTLMNTSNEREEYDDATKPEVNAYIQRIKNSYLWTNYGDSTLLEPITGDQCSDDCGYTIAEMSNWWSQRAAAFDGTAETVGTDSGVGCGTLASRPATCTTGVAYWATAQSCSDLTGMVGANPTSTINGTLYKCTATNTWTSYYQPYAYPHPLRGSNTKSVMTVGNTGTVTSGTAGSMTLN